MFWDVDIFRFYAVIFNGRKRELGDAFSDRVPFEGLTEYVVAHRDFLGTLPLA